MHMVSPDFIKNSTVNLGVPAFFIFMFVSLIAYFEIGIDLVSDAHSASASGERDFGSHLQKINKPQ